jgi:hypothetical protein
VSYSETELVEVAPDAAFDSQGSHGRGPRCDLHAILAFPRAKFVVSFP